MCGSPVVSVDEDEPLICTSIARLTADFSRCRQLAPGVPLSARTCAKTHPHLWCWGCRHWCWCWCWEVLVLLDADAQRCFMLLLRALWRTRDDTQAANLHHCRILGTDDAAWGIHIVIHISLKFWWAGTHCIFDFCEETYRKPNCFHRCSSLPRLRGQQVNACQCKPLPQSRKFAPSTFLFLRILRSSLWHLFHLDGYCIAFHRFIA